jgi:hypothetical protein
MSPRDARPGDVSSAAHEAAHVVVALALRLPVFSATCVPTRQNDGRVEVGDRKTPRARQRRQHQTRVPDLDEAIRQTAVSLAGYLQERREGTSRRSAAANASGDFEKVSGLIRQWALDRKQLLRAWRTSARILHRASNAHDLICRHLEDVGTINDGRTFAGLSRRFRLEELGCSIEGELVRGRGR